MAATYSADDFRRAWASFNNNRNERMGIHAPQASPPAQQPMPTINRNKTVLGRIRTASEPPKVLLFRLPAHRLLTLEPSTDGGIYLKVYIGRPGNTTEATELMLDKVGSTRQNPGRPRWTERPLRDFMYQHCRLCPHMLANSLDTETAICPASCGQIDDAFNCQDGLNTRTTCLAGHERPTCTEGDNRRPPITFVPHLPMDYGLRLSSDGSHEVSNVFVRYLLEHNGQFFRGSHQRAFNTWAGGGICWGSGQEYPELPEITDRLYRSNFNLDLVEDFNRIFRHYRVAHRSYRSAQAQLTPGAAPNGDQMRALANYGFEYINEARILSVDNDVNALLLVTPRDIMSPAFYTLAASGAAVEDDRILLPLKQHILQAGNNYIAGYITPILPAINRCWFLQVDPNSRNDGKLLGQIDPPALPE